MGSKQPRGSEKKKPGKNLKEKRVVKNEKKTAHQGIGRGSER